MKISDLDEGIWGDKLKQGSACFKIGPFTVQLKSKIPQVSSGLYRLYSEFELVDPSAQFIDFDIRVDSPTWHRHWFRPQVLFSLDGYSPFKPLPQSHALAVFEWGLNWCIASSAHRFLMIHAAVLEKSGRALILPAPPESGKSTLCAGLAASGWRLLSDEMALVDLETGYLTPLPRPISLKNQSISVIQNQFPSVVCGPLCRDTHKGDVIHVRPTAGSVGTSNEKALPALVVYPKYVAGSDTEFVPVKKALSAIRLAENAFNFNVVGAKGFEVLASLSQTCDSYELSYSSLVDVIPKIMNLMETSPGFQKKAS